MPIEGVKYPLFPSQFLDSFEHAYKTLSTWNIKCLVQKCGTWSRPVVSCICALIRITVFLILQASSNRL